MNTNRPKTFLAALVAMVLATTVVGCSAATDNGRPISPERIFTAPEPVSAPVPTVETHPSTTPEAETAERQLAGAITGDREAALFFIEQNGGCQEANIERCIADMLMFIAPESPAIEPALQRAAELADLQLAEFYAGVAKAEAEKEQELAEFYAGVAKAEAEEKEQELAEFYAGVAKAEAEKKEQELAEFYAGVAKAEADEEARAVREAIRFADDLLRATCGGNGGKYIYWINPPRAEITVCYSSVRNGGSGGRTGAVCNDGTSSSATGSGACSWHGGVWYWTY
jgi:hypothetical protein